MKKKTFENVLGQGEKLVTFLFLFSLNDLLFFNKSHHSTLYYTILNLTTLGTCLSHVIVQFLLFALCIIVSP